MKTDKEKEANRIYMQSYRLREGMKEKQAKYNKQWKKDNADKVKANSKKYKESLKDGFYTVYYLKEDHYVGQTISLRRRLGKHKRNGRHVLDAEVLAKFETREEALAFESRLHDMGYHGRNNSL